MGESFFYLFYKIEFGDLWIYSSSKNVLVLVFGDEENVSFVRVGGVEKSSRLPVPEGESSMGVSTNYGVVLEHLDGPDEGHLVGSVVGVNRVNYLLTLATPRLNLPVVVPTHYERVVWAVGDRKSPCYKKN